MGNAQRNRYRKGVKMLERNYNGELMEAEEMHNKELEYIVNQLVERAQYIAKTTLTEYNPDELQLMLDRFDELRYSKK